MRQEQREEATEAVIEADCGGDGVKRSEEATTETAVATEYVVVLTVVVALRPTPSGVVRAL